MLPARPDSQADENGYSRQHGDWPSFEQTGSEQDDHYNDEDRPRMLRQTGAESPPPGGGGARNVVGSPQTLVEKQVRGDSLTDLAADLRSAAPERGLDGHHRRVGAHQSHRPVVERECRLELCVPHRDM